MHTQKWMTYFSDWRKQIPAYFFGAKQSFQWSVHKSGPHHTLVTSTDIPRPGNLSCACGQSHTWTRLARWCPELSSNVYLVCCRGRRRVLCAQAALDRPVFTRHLPPLLIPLGLPKPYVYVPLCFPACSSDPLRDRVLCLVLTYFTRTLL